MRILITGGNGYIAKSLTSQLGSGFEILSLSRQELDLTDSIAVDEFFREKEFSVVIHTATRGGSRLKQEDDSIEEDNVKMFNNLIKNKESFEKLITFGSGAEFAENLTPYGRSKKIITKLASNLNYVHNLRIYAVFDENELETRFIKGSILKVLNKQPITIHQDKLMDFIYMKDLVSIIKGIILDQIKDREIDCVYEEEVTLSSIASLICTIAGCKVKYEVLQPGLADEYIGSYKKLPIKYIGLLKGIQNTYKQLLNEAN